MRRRIMALAAAAAVIAAVAVGASLSSGHEDGDGALLQAQAVSALGVKDGDCVLSSDPLFRLPDLAAAEADAARLPAPAFVRGMWFGSPEELADHVQGSIVASGEVAVWTMTDADGAKVVQEWVRVELPSGRIVLRVGGSIQLDPGCSGAHSGG